VKSFRRNPVAEAWSGKQPRLHIEGMTGDVSVGGSGTTSKKAGFVGEFSGLVSAAKDNGDCLWRRPNGEWGKAG